MPLDREALEAALGAERAETTQLRTLGELLADPATLRPPRQAIGYLVLEQRVALFSAREKLGKTTLARQAIAAATNGTDFLGRPTLPAVVLWYGLDEALGDTVRGLRDADAAPARVYLTDQAPSPAMMAAHIERTGATLVVVDALSDLLAGSGRRENDTDFGDLVRPYVTVSRETGAALLLIHHATKNGREYRGTTRLGAVVDMIVNMRAATRPDDEGEDLDLPTADDDPRRILEVKGRGIRERVKIAFDGARYTIGDGAASLPDRITRALLAAGDALTTNQVTAAVSGRRETVLDALDALVAAGRVTSRKGPRGATLYTLAPARDWSPALVPEPSAAHSGNQSREPVTATDRQGREPREPVGTSAEPVGTGHGNRSPMTGSRSAVSRDAFSGTSRGTGGAVRVTLDDGAELTVAADDPDLSLFSPRIVKTEAA